MRALTQVALAAAAAMGVNIAEQVQRGIDNPQGPPVGQGGRHGKRKFMSAEHYKKHDPYYGIPSKGRRGARQRMQQQYDQCTRGKLNDQGRGIGGPVFISRYRNKVFLAALGAGMSHNEAMKHARRAPAISPDRGQGRPVPAHRSGPGCPQPTVNPAHHSGAAAA
jgi:hypothetical protein